MKITGWVFIVVAVMVGLVGLFLFGVGLSGQGDVSGAALVFMAAGNLTFCAAMIVAGRMMIHRAGNPPEDDPDAVAEKAGSPG